MAWNHTEKVRGKNDNGLPKMIRYSDQIKVAISKLASSGSRKKNHWIIKLIKTDSHFFTLLKDSGRNVQSHSDLCLLHVLTAFPRALHRHLLQTLHNGGGFYPSGIESENTTHNGSNQLSIFPIYMYAQLKLTSHADALRYRHPFLPTNDFRGEER